MNIAWPPAGIRQRKQELRRTRDALRTLPKLEDILIEQSLARYLIVRSTGYLEAVRDDASDLYCGNRSPLEVASRVRHNLRTGVGVRPEQLIQFVGSFSTNWAEELQSILNQNEKELRDTLGAIVKARKQIAHGDGDMVTAGKALRWSEAAEGLGDWFIDRFNPNISPAASIRPKGSVAGPP